MAKKAIFLMLSLVLSARFALPVQAADLVAVPQNVRQPAVLTPVPVQTRPNELSLEALETKISDIFKPEKKKAALATTYSGTCGDNVNWNLGTSSGKLTISGSGAMTNYSSSDRLSTNSPWESYKNSIKSVTIEKGVTAIGKYAFTDCSKLNSVTITDSITSIGYYAFRECDKLSSVNIPNSVTSIDTGAFRNCRSLPSITIPNKVKCISNTAFDSCVKLTSVTIPNSVTSIEHAAFYQCYSLTSVTIPKSVTSIGTSAFYKCTGLTSVIYGGTSNTSTSSSVFSACDILDCVLVPTAYTSDIFCGRSVVKGNICPVPTRSKSPSRSRSPMATRSRSPMATPSRSPSKSPMATPSKSPMATPSKSPTASPSNKFTAPVDYFRQKSDTIFVSKMLYHTLVLD